MATVTLSNTPTVISECDSDTDWNADRALTLDTELFKTGTGAIGATMHDTIDDVWYEAPGTFDLSADNTVLRIWLFCVVIGQMENDAYPGVLLRLGDGTNTAFWNITGSDSYEGGWLMLQVDVGLTPDSGTAPNLTLVNECGVKINLDQNVRNNNNTWVDKVHFTATGYTAYGGTSSDKIGLSEIVTADAAAGWGITQLFNSIFFLTAPITVGDSSNTTYFEMDGDTAVFIDDRVDSTFFEFAATGASTNISMLNSAISASGQPFKFDCGNINALSIVGTNITNARLVVFYDGNVVEGSVFTDVDASTIANDPDGCTWNLSGLITVSATGSLNNCIINESTGTVAVSIATLDRLDKNTFNSDDTGHAVNLGTISSTQSMVWDNTDNDYTASSSGNETILVNVDSGITLTINVASGASTPSVYNTGTGTVNVVSGSVSIDIHVEDQSAVDIAGALVYVDEDLGAAGNITNTTTNSTGEVSAPE